jgi:hypothetical protein
LIKATSFLKGIPRSGILVRRASRDLKMPWIACGVFLTISLSITVYARNQHSGWILASFPGGYSPNQTILSFTRLCGQDPIMAENEMASVEPVAFFSGLKDAAKDQNCYIIRAYNGVFATLLAPLVGVWPALVLVNWLAWAVCAWVAWRLSLDLFQDPLAALLAVIFVAGGIGMVIHISDYSAHLLSFASYSLGVYLLHTRGFLFRQRSLRTHLMMGAYLAVANLVYSNALMLTVVYVLVSLRHNARRHIAAAVLLSLSARPLWKIVLTYLGAQVGDSEVELFQVALKRWGELALQGPLAIGERVAVLVSEFAFFFDSPGVVVLGLFACFYLPRKPELRWFGAAVLGIPLLSLLAWSDFNWSRGYLIYGDLSVWIYCWIGGLLAKGFWGGGRRRLAAALALFLTIGSHFAWSTAHFYHELGPLKAYVEGWPVGLPYFLHPQTQVLSMTGLEPTPTLAGGGASLPQAGAWTRPSELEVGPDAVSFRDAFARRLLPFAYLALLAGTLAYSWPRRLQGGVAVLVASVLSAFMSAQTMRTLPAFFDFQSSIVLPAAAKMSYGAKFDPSFLERLKMTTEAEDILDFYVPQWIAEDEPPTLAVVSVFAGSTPLSLKESEKHYLIRVENSLSAVQALAEGGSIKIELVNSNDRGVLLAGWQRRGLTGRVFEITAPVGSSIEDSPVLPAIEIRLRRPDLSIKLIGF